MLFPGNGRRIMWPRGYSVGRSGLAWAGYRSPHCTGALPTPAAHQSDFTQNCGHAMMYVENMATM
jgi:hypothetical protein